MPHDAYARAPAPLPLRNTRENANTGRAIAAVHSARNHASVIPGSAVRSIAGKTVAIKKPGDAEREPGERAEDDGQRRAGPDAAVRRRRWLNPRLLPVPDGLAGLRLDVALSRLFGLSRSAAAGLIDDGAVSLDGAAPARSDKVRAGAWLEITIPDPVDLAAAPPIAGRRPRRCSTRTTTSWWWTSRSGWPRIRASAGRARR